MSDKTNNRVYISWFILASFFLYQYILRCAPGVLIEEIRHDFLMNAEDFALLGSLFYYGYSLIQIPLGILIDKYGIKLIAVSSIFLCMLGSLLMSVTTLIPVAFLSRIILGVGAASAFMSCLKLANDYLPKKIKGMAIGATLSAGAIGALFTGAPLNYLLVKFASWQEAFYLFSLIGIVLIVFAAVFLPNNRNPKLTYKKSERIIPLVLNVVTNKTIMLYAFIAIALYAPLSVLADLWGTAFLMKKFLISREQASPILMNIYIGMAFGSIILPYLVERHLNLNKAIKISAFMLLILFTILVYMPNLSEISLITLLILIGFFCGAEMLCFTAALWYVDPKHSGVTIGVVNTLNMLGGAIMQHVIGVYLDINWSGKTDNFGLRLYSTEDYVEAFSILVIIIAICLITALTMLNNKKVNQE